MLLYKLFFSVPFNMLQGSPSSAMKPKMFSTLKKYRSNNLIPKVKLTALSRTQRHFLSLTHASFVCKHHVISQAPSHNWSALRWQDCCCLLANNTEEEVQMNPRACRGHVYLTLWPVSQPAVRTLLTVDLSMIFRVTGASVWWAAHFIRDRDTRADEWYLRWSESIAESSWSISIQLRLMESWCWQWP